MLFVVIKVQMHAFVMGRSKLQTLNRFIALCQLDVHVWWIIAERLCSRNKRLTRTEPVSVPHAFHDTQIQTVPVCFWLTHGGGDSSISVSGHTATCCTFSTYDNSLYGDPSTSFMRVSGVRRCVQMCSEGLGPQVFK